MGSSAFPVSGASARVAPSFASPAISSWRLQSKQLANKVVLSSGRQARLVCANAKVSTGKGSSGADIIMVDPVEAKRLAAKQMQEIQAKEKLERDRKIEAINGAWAMIGLTAGIVVEGKTGKGILSQLAGYWDSVTRLFPGYAATESHSLSLSQLVGFWDSFTSLVDGYASR